MIAFAAWVGTLHATNTAKEVKVKVVKKQCIESIRAIKFYRQTTWKWQDYFDIKRSRYSKTRIQRGACKYAHWVALRWQKRAWKWRDFDRDLEVANKDFGRAARFTSAVFPSVSEVRLWYRADREGGHGGWVPNRNGSGAGGWFQFMEGTFYGRASGAFDAARKRGFPIPNKYKNWYSVLGQNLTAAYMFDLGLECSGEGWAASC